MGKQIYFEDVTEGMEIPTLTKNPTTRQLVKYAGASGDFYEIHYDKDYAIGNQLPGPIIHGALKNAWLGQVMTDWIGPEGVLKKLSCQYRGMDEPGSPAYCKGKVVKKHTENGEHLVDCEIWLENAKGEPTTPGKATAALPSRGGS
ncbi:MAG: MaoC/PaaZ C-terminal domain-containing protein [Dehalococcoidia bacterium]